MKSVPTRVMITALGLALAAPLTGCSLYQSDSEFFNSAPSTQSLTRDNLEKAHALRLQKKYRDAVKILSQLVLANPDDGPVLAEYGKVLAEQGRAGEAQEFLKRAIELQPHDATLYSALGVAQDQAGDAAGAEKSYKQALGLSPNDPAILNNYALSRLMAGHVAEAENLIQLAKLAGTNPRIEQNARLIADVAKNAAQNAAHKTTPPPKPAEAEIREKAKPIISDIAPEPQSRPDGETPVPQQRPTEKDPVPQLRPE